MTTEKATCYLKIPDVYCLYLNVPAVAKAMADEEGGEHMNKNLIIFIVVILVLVFGYSLVKNSSKTQPTTTTNTQTQVSPSSAMKESPSKEPEAMSQKKEHMVVLGTNGFDPATITVKKGEKVVWENKSGDTATVDSDNHPTHLLYPPLNMGAFEDIEKVDGKRHELVFDKAGKYTYHDHFHPSRRGTVVVE